MSPIGEDTLFHVPGTDEYFNAEVAPAQAPVLEQPSEQASIEERETPGVVGVERLARELGVPITSTVKTMLYVVDDAVVAVAVRGDYEVNEIKLRKALDATSVAFADEETVKRVSGAEVGYAGLINLPEEVRIVVDDAVGPHSSISSSELTKQTITASTSTGSVTSRVLSSSTTSNKQKQGIFILKAARSMRRSPPSKWEIFSHSRPSIQMHSVCTMLTRKASGSPSSWGATASV